MADKERKPTDEQRAILTSEAKNLVISASAGSGKTFIVIEKLIDLILNKKVPLERLLVLTFTKVAAQEIKTRLTNAILERGAKEFAGTLDSLPLSDISTIDSFCEKVIKRNISTLDINENFTILDEKSGEKFKRMAFLNTYQYFYENNFEMFEEIYLSFMKNKDSIEECIYYLQNYFSSKYDEEKLVQDFIDNIASFNLASQERIKQHFAYCQKEGEKILRPTYGLKMSPSEKIALQNFTNFFNIRLDGDLFSICKEFNNLSMPVLKGNHRDEIKIPFANAKHFLKEITDITSKYTYIPEGVLQKAENGDLAKAILTFYQLFVKNYTKLKNKKSALDYADLERITRFLLENEEVKEDLQSRYDYIFIDEYQDTNRLQESILKPIAESGHFIAVGDIKQGIYGFRNASMEIMLEDIENFSKEENGQALYLNGNFRTDESILEFVNDIFDKIMTIESVGIDYKENSTLKGLMHFEKDENPSVAVDIVLPNKDEEDLCSGIYQLKNDNLQIDEKYKNEVNAIFARIEKSLLSNIYDAKLEKFRKVQYGDIALLFRNRSALMDEVVKRLREKGIPLSADLKEPLIEDSQISLLTSLLKLTLQEDDDISLAAVMCSIFGKFTIDELTQMRKGKEEKFSQIVLNSQDEKILKFKEMIELFKFEIGVFGVIKALCRLFNRYNYYEYIKSLNNGREKLSKINSLFKAIRASGQDFDVAGVITMLERAENKGGDEGGGNAIIVTTIHSTKGLEYPIVILCGCGENLHKPYTKQYILNDKYGLGCYLNNFDTMQQIPSPAFIASKLDLKKREFVDEIMIFYVALTRAQNHLYIIGKGKKKDFSFYNLLGQNSYLKLIMFALGENFISLLFEQGRIDTTNRQFIAASDFEISEEKEKKLFSAENKFKEQLKKYDEFVYPNEANCKLSLKNSVTGILKEDEENVINLSQKVNSISDAILQGNAYHEALKLIDFDTVKCVEDIKSIVDLKDRMSEGYYELLDFDLLFKNIKIIKSVMANCQLFKEKEFIMQCNLNEIEDGGQGEDKFIVQGTVDLFGMGDKIILIDYKYSNASGEILLERYHKQLELYSLAIEKATGRKVDEKYILSLKEGKLINYQTERK